MVVRHWLEQNGGTVAEHAFYLFHGEILSRNIARTARRQLGGVGVYLQTLADLPDKDALWIIELTVEPL